MAAVRAAQCLCSLLHDDPSLWAHVRLQPEQMPHGYALTVFLALSRLRDRGAKPDRAAFAAAIREVGGVQVRGLETMIAGWAVEQVASAANLDLYQRTIEEAAELKRLRIIRAELGAHIEEGDVSGAVAALNRALTASPVQAKAVTVKQALWDVMQEMERPKPALPLGLPRLDGMMDGGVRAGELVVVAARPGVGKSAFLLQVLLHVLRRDVPVALWTLEMSVKQWTQRALSSIARVPIRKIRNGHLLGRDEMQDVVAASAELNTLPLLMAETWDTTPDGWRMQAARMVREHGVGLLAIDYLQLMQPGKRTHSREQEVAQMSRIIKLATIELDVPILLLAQLNRDAENKVPTMSNLRESGAIEQDANVVFLLHREIDKDARSYKDHGLGILAKNRDGETGAFPLRYDRYYYRFDELTDREAPHDHRNRSAVPYAD